MDLSQLGDRLLKAGAPVLKSTVENAIGGIGGKIAGGVVDMLAEALGTQPTPDAIVKRMDEDPQGSAVIVRHVEDEASKALARMAEANRDVMMSYHGVLRDDAKQEGILSRLWRPVFAVVFTICFLMITITVCRAIWISQLTGFEAAAGTIALIILGGCAVLGVQVWQRGEEKKAGV